MASHNFLSVFQVFQNAEILGRNLEEVTAKVTEVSAALQCESESFFKKTEERLLRHAKMEVKVDHHLQSFIREQKRLKFHFVTFLSKSFSRL